MLGPTTSMQIDLPCIQIQALKFKILNLSFLAVYLKSYVLKSIKEVL